MYIYIYICICMYIYIYIYIHTYLKALTGHVVVLDTQRGGQRCRKRGGQHGGGRRALALDHGIPQDTYCMIMQLYDVFYITTTIMMIQCRNVWLLYVCVYIYMYVYIYIYIYIYICMYVYIYIYIYMREATINYYGEYRVACVARARASPRSSAACTWPGATPPSATTSRGAPKASWSASSTTSSWWPAARSRWSG